MVSRRRLVLSIPNISKRRGQPTNLVRAQKLSKAYVDYYLKRWNINEMDMKSNTQNLFNIYENHRQCPCSKKNKDCAPEHAESVIIIVCCNAVGNSILPMVIYKEKCLEP